MSQEECVVLASSSEDDATPPPPSRCVQAALESEDVLMDMSMSPPPAQPHQSQRQLTPEQRPSSRDEFFASPPICRLLTPTRDTGTQTECIGIGPNPPAQRLFWTMVEWLERTQVKYCNFSFILAAAPAALIADTNFSFYRDVLLIKVKY